LKPTGLSPGLEEFTHFIHPEDQSPFKESIRKIFEEQHPLEADFRILKADGRPKFARMKSKMLKNADGDLLIVGVIKDITASTKLEKQLREINEQLILQNEAFRQAEKTTHIGSWTWNLENDEVHFSEQVHNIFGLKTSPGKSNFESLMHSFIQWIDPEYNRPSVNFETTHRS
jgi:PAS domain-containing protein